MFENNLIAGVSGQGGGYNIEIEDSLRFNDDDGAYLSRTPSVAGDRKTWTWSGWVKRGNLGSQQPLLSAGSSNSSEDFFVSFESDNTIRIIELVSGSATLLWKTTQVFRDVSSWYHIVIVLDMTQATSTNRVKIYINGEIVTAYSSQTTPAQNTDLDFNSAVLHGIGRRVAASTYFDGYLAEINFIDGQALTADDFGEINADTGEWSPIAYSGTYGTNGFYLPFDGNANDSSGNGNNWTENNLASTDYMIDTPTNNFSVLQNSPLGTGVSYQEGNLEFNNATLNTAQSGSTIRFASGTWYCEVTPTLNGDLGWYGVRNPETNDYWIYYGFSGNKFSYISGTLTGSAYGSAYTVGDVIGISYNADTGDLQFYKNNVAQGVIATGFAGQELEFYFADGASDTAHNGVVNFGADSSFAGNKTRQGNTDANGIGDFYYTPPAGGYLALCTDNLPAPAIEQPETQFNVVTYTGNSADRNIDVGFEADFVWIKRREIASQNCLFDRVRGNGQFLFSNLSNAEFNGVNDGIHFDYASGFNIDVGANVSYYNETGGSYVAWCWKAGGTAVSNTDGAITSQVSANVDAGFSVATYTGNSSTGTIGHGLSKKPELVIIKNRGAVASWFVGSPSFGTNNYLSLNSTSAMLNYVDGSGGAFFNYGGWSDSVVNVYNANSTSINSSSYSYAMYSFHSVDGFSKIGTYVGNGSANGPFVYTGFKPAFVLYKRAIGGTGNWILADNEREGYNWDNPVLYPNLTNAESSGSSIDILSNGFKVNNAVAGSDHNASGSTYIYMAFAEHPFNYSTGR